MTTHINMHQSPLLHIRDADTRMLRSGLSLSSTPGEIGDGGSGNGDCLCR
jgi:hypothetical protein